MDTFGAFSGRGVKSRGGTRRDVQRRVNGRSRQAGRQDLGKATAGRSFYWSRGAAALPTRGGIVCKKILFNKIFTLSGCIVNILTRTATTTVIASLLIFSYCITLERERLKKKQVGEAARNRFLKRWIEIPWTRSCAGCKRRPRCYWGF